jgi:hypothetical protein
MRELPFLEDGARHGQGGPGKFGRRTGSWIVEQPGFERVGRRVLFDGALQQVTLDAKTECVRRLIALAFPAAAFRRFERGEQRAADVRRPQRA